MATVNRFLYSHVGTTLLLGVLLIWQRTDRTPSATHARLPDLARQIPRTRARTSRSLVPTNPNICPSNRRDSESGTLGLLPGPSSLTEDLPKRDRGPDGGWCLRDSGLLERRSALQRTRPPTCFRPVRPNTRWKVRYAPPEWR